MALIDLDDGGRLKLSCLLHLFCKFCYDIECKNSHCFRQLFRHDETLRMKIIEFHHPIELLQGLPFHFQALEHVF